MNYRKAGTMKKALVSFVIIGVICSFTSSMNAQQQNGKPPESRDKESLCNLEANPEKYIGKEFELVATFVHGFEMSWLTSPRACSTNSGSGKRIRYLVDERLKENSVKKSFQFFEKKIRSAKTPRRVTGTYRIRVERFEKDNPSDNRFDYQIRILGVKAIVR